jgi:hypothetical protein
VKRTRNERDYQDAYPESGLTGATKAMLYTEGNEERIGLEKSPHFIRALEDAEHLLKHAAEGGIPVTPETRSAVLHARAALSSGWTENEVAKLLLALTQLAAALRPVTATSLRACHSDARPAMHSYLIWAIILSVVIIPASIATFVSSNISNTIKADVNKANALAVKLSAEVGQTDVGSSEQIADLQEYASTIRSIYARCRRLNQFVFPHVEIPKTLDEATDNDKKNMFELPVPLPIDDLSARERARNTLTQTYQDVRYFAQNLVTDISTFYAAINYCLLPVLYALLGTCAYLLRTFEDQMYKRTFIPSVANSARFVMAAIGGTVVGLFGSFAPEASASPLAFAFLVGYAVEIFFAFLEGLIKTFTKTVPDPSDRRAVALQEEA